MKIFALAIIALCASLNVFALAGESPLFKFDHQSNGVNENTEVRLGIDHPSDVGSQKGASLSETDFLFDKQDHDKINDSPSTAFNRSTFRVGRNLNPAQCSARNECDAAPLRLFAGWLPSERAGSGWVNRHATRVEDAITDSTDWHLCQHQAINHSELTYGYWENPSCAIAQNDQATESASSEVAPQNGDGCRTAAVFPQPGCTTGAAADAGGNGAVASAGLFWSYPESCPVGNHRGAAQTLTPPKIAHNEPDSPDGSIGHPALFVSSAAQCSALHGYKLGGNHV